MLSERLTTDKSVRPLVPPGQRGPAPAPTGWDERVLQVLFDPRRVTRVVFSRG